MYWRGKIWGCFLFVSFFGALATSAGQAPQEVTSSSGSLKARVLLFYRTVQKGDRLGALDLVAPEAKNGFLRVNYDGLVDFRIVGVRFSDDGRAAAVRILRTDRFAGFPQLLDRETIDTWKRIDGQWYVLFPSFEEMDTPFGTMRFSQPDKELHGASLPGFVPEQPNKVTPEMYRKALRTVLQDEDKRQAEAKKAEGKKAGEEKKSNGKKPGEQAAPKPEPQG